MAPSTETTPPTKSETARKYHDVPNAVYFFPNDAPEHERLDAQASHLSATMGHRLIHADIPSTAERILEIGCGTGVVTATLGKQYPLAKIYGIDLSRVPSRRDKPANVHFVQGNVLELFDGTSVQHNAANAQSELDPLDWDGNTDLVYHRLLICGMNNWPKYASTVFRLLKPGGFAEMQDLDFTFYNANNEVIDSGFEWLHVMKKAGAEKGLDLDCGSHARMHMRDAGFEAIRTDEYRWPWGGEGEETAELRAFGEYLVREQPNLLHDAMARILGGKGYSEEQIRQWQSDMRSATRAEPGKHCKFTVTVGRKPFSGQAS